MIWLDGGSIPPRSTILNKTMPHTPPIKIRALANSGVLSEERFFRLLSERCNFVDPKTVKSFYLSLVRLMTAELRKNGVVRLPHIGDLALVKQKDTVGWVGNTQKKIEERYALRFYVNGAFRDYFADLQRRGGPDIQLDPREKVLGEMLP